MAVSLDTFRQAAQIAGRVTLDQRHEGQLETSQGRMGGKLVAWVKDTWPSSSVKAENRAATEAFVKAVRAEHGDLLGNLAQARLTGDIKAGRPLTDRTINMILDATGKAQVDLARMNESTGKTAANNDDPAKANSFGQVFEQVSTALGSTRAISDLDPGRLADARKAIERGVKAEAAQGGNKNGRIVDDVEAHAIATREIKKLLVAEGREALIQQLTSPGDGSTHLDRAFAEGLAKRGITDLSQADFAIAGMLQAAKTSILSATFNSSEDAHTVPIDQPTAEKLVQAELDKFLDAKGALLDKAKELAAGDKTHEALLTRLATGNEKLKPAVLERLWQSRAVAETAYKTLADPTAGLADQVRVLKDLTAMAGKAQRDLGLDAEGANRFLSGLFTVAHTTAGLDREQSVNLAKTMNSPDMAALQETLVLPMIDSGELMQHLGATGREMIGMLSVIGPLKEAAGVDPADLDREPIDDLEQVPHRVLTALQANGIDLRPPLGVGHDGSGAFSPSAQKIIEGQLNKTNEPLGPEGITGSMLRDIPRAEFTLGGKPLSKDPAEAVRQLKEFCTGPSGKVDQNMLWAISQIAHQGTFGVLTDAMVQGKGPIRGFVDGPNKTAYDISKNDLGDVTIRGVTAKVAEGIMDPLTGNRTELDDSSSFAMNFEMVLNKANYDFRELEPVMLRPPSYSFALNATQ